MTYRYAFEKNDYKRIDKLNTLTSTTGFYDEVRKFTRNIHSDHSLRRWECLASLRYEELWYAKHGTAINDAE